MLPVGQLGKLRAGGLPALVGPIANRSQNTKLPHRALLGLATYAQTQAVLLMNRGGIHSYVAHLIQPTLLTLVFDWWDNPSDIRGGPIPRPALTETSTLPAFQRAREATDDGSTTV